MSESKIVQALISSLSSSDPAITATPNQTARFDVNCNQPNSSDSLIGINQILFPRFAQKAIPSGGCIFKRTGLKPISSDEIKIKTGSFKSSLMDALDKLLNQPEFDIVNIKREVARCLYEEFALNPLTNDIPNLPNVYLQNYKSEGPLDNPERLSINSKFKKISYFVYIPSDAILSIMDVIQDAKYLNNFGRIKNSGIALDFSEYVRKLTDNEDDITNIMLEFVPFFNYKESEIEGADQDISIPRFHGGYFTTISNLGLTSLIVKLPDISGKNYRGNSGSYYEDLEQIIVLQLHYLNNKEENESEKDSYKNIIIDFEKSFNGEIISYDEDYNFLLATEDLNVTITGVNLDVVKHVYLSYVAPSNFSKPKGYDDIKHKFTDFSVCPNSSLFINENKIRPNNGRKESETNAYILENFSNTFSSTYIEKFSFLKSGFPTTLYKIDRDYKNNYDGLAFLSRQDELLASNQEEKLSLRKIGITKNWYSSKAMNSSSFGVQTTPRIYEDYHIPESWIKGSISPGFDGEYNLTFSKSDLVNIIANKIAFSVNLSDGKGQIHRISNQPILIDRSPPSIISLSSNGFRESGIVLYPGYSLRIDGEGFIEGLTKVSIEADLIYNIEIDRITPTIIRIVVPDIQSGIYNLFVKNGSEYKDSVKIYISPNASSDIAGAPSLRIEKMKIDGNFLTAKNLGEIPLSYDSPTSSIKIKTKRFTFTDAVVPIIKAFLYIKTNDIKLVDFISNDYAKIGQDTYIFNDIRWQMSTSPGGDFYKTSLRQAVLKFPGTGNIRRPLRSLLNFENINGNDIGIYISDSDNAKGINETNSLSVSFKKDDLPFFSDQPTIIGMAGSTNDFDAVKTSYFRNFEFSKFGANSGSVRAAFTSEFTSLSDEEIKFSPIKSISSIKRLLVFFKSIISDDFPQRYTFFISGQKVSFLKVKNIEKVSNNGTYAIWRASIDDVDTDSLLGGVGSVFIKRKDRKRGVEIGSESLYIDITSGNDNINAEKITVGTNEVVKLTEGLFIPFNLFKPYGDEALSYGRDSDPFGISAPDSGLFGNIIKSPSEPGKIDMIDFDAEVNFAIEKAKGGDPDPSKTTPFYKIGLESQNSDATLFFGDKLNESLKDTQIKNDVKIYAYKTELSYLPSSIRFEKGSEVNNYHENDEGFYKTFHRIKITNAAVIMSNTPKILAVEPLNFSGGDEVKIIVEAMNPFKVKVFVNTTRARIVDRGRVGGATYITIIAPKDVDSIHLLQGKCQEIIIKPTRFSLLGAELDLGVTFVNDAIRAITDSINGFISDKMGDVQALIDRVKDKFLTFINLRLDKVNIAKELINSFCDMSFHLTAELNIYLKNFSILLIPVKVIFCIIDVICSLLNPTQLAPAIVRLFECLYDLLLLLPPIAVPVLVLQLFLHLLELLECLIEKIINTIAITTIVILAIQETVALIQGDKEPDFKYLLMLEGILLDNFLTIDADLQVLGPIAQILALILQLLQLVFRFPCKIGPQSMEPDCGIDGTMLAGFLTASVLNEDGTLKNERLLPVAQSKPKDSTILPEYSDKNITISEISSILAVGSSPGDDIDFPSAGATAISKDADESFFDAVSYDEDSFRADSNNNVSTSISFTKIVKRSRTPQEVKFVFNSKGDESLFRKRLDYNSQIDSPITLLNLENSNKLEISNTSSLRARNIYSLLDSEEFINIKEKDGKFFANSKPLTIPIEIDGVTHLRTFDGIPKMVIMDDLSNFYIINDDGIEFNDELKIDTIKATIINTSFAPDSNYSRDTQEIDDGDEGPEEVTIYKYPKIYFVDVRAAAEQIAMQCSVTSINNMLIEISNPEETARIVQDASDCLNSFITGISSKVSEMRAETALGKVPTPFAENFAENLGKELVLCINRGLNDICPQVINQLNTSFKILEDTDETPVDGFPDLVVGDDIMDGFETDGPPLTGAREYAAGIGDSATIIVSKEATVQIIPRDSYDEVIIPAYDLSDKIEVQIISDTTGSARVVKKNVDGVFKNISRDGAGNYYAYITSDRPGQVKIKARICSKVIQAITYAGLEGIIAGDTTTGIDCIPDSAADITSSIPLGAQVRVDRVLKINFIESDETRIVSGSIDPEAISTESGMFGIGG
jgi:hypothetical protein